MELPLKDSNEMLTQGKEKQFIDCLFKAKQATPDGIISSGGLMDKIIEEALTPKLLRLQNTQNALFHRPL